MAFIDFGDSIIHLDNIIRVEKAKMNYYLNENDYQITIFTRDGGKEHILFFENKEKECHEQYNKIIEILKQSDKIFKIE